MSAGEPLRFTVTVSEADFLAGVRLMMRDFARRFVPAALAVGVGLFLLVQYLKFGDALATRHNMLVVVAGVAIFLAIPLAGMALFYFFALPPMARRQFAAQPYAAVPTTYEMDDAGMRTANAHGTDDLPWSMIGGASADRHVVLVRRGPTEAFTIPRAHLSAEDDAALTGLLRRHVVWKGSQP